MKLSINSSQVNVVLSGTQMKLSPQGPPLKATICTSSLKLSLCEQKPIVVKMGIPGLPGPPGPQGLPGIRGADGVGIAETKWKFHQDLTPSPDGVETEFFLPGGDKARHAVPGFMVRIVYNGQELKHGAGADFTMSESGGAGTGYDKAKLCFAPKTGDLLWSHYVLV